ncbi:TPA: hypothetical protein DEP90_02335, partial [Patescibacteria group bacterium]|nr:hypothetical protein [Patescibacteria group bacterium]
MKRLIKKSLYKIFVSLFLVVYTFMPPIISLEGLFAIDGPITTKVSAADWPNCGFQCQAGDTYVTSFEFVGTDGNPITQCTPGQDIEGSIIVTIYNNTNSDRKAPILLGDIYEGDTLLTHLETSANGSTVDGICVSDTGIIPAKEFITDEIYSFTWNCGELLTVQNLVLSWTTGNETCEDFFNAPSCGNRTTKCYSRTTFTVTTSLVANFSANNACVGDTVNFIDETSGGLLPYTYNWLLAPGTSSTEQNPNWIYTGPGTKEVTLNVWDSQSPPAYDDATKYIEIWELPTASFTVDSTTGYAPYIVSFTDTSSPGDGEITSWYWEFGDGSTSSERNPSHEYTTPGSYEAYLTITDEHGCTHQSEAMVMVINEALATLTLQKNVVNDNGGDKTVNDFDITLEGTSVTFGEPVVDGYTSKYTSNKIPLLVGQPYKLSELNDVSGYTSGTWDCGTVDSQTPTTTVITPSDSSDIICTITNDDKPGKLIVNKLISGSDASYDIFSFTVNNGNSIEFESDGQNEIVIDAGIYTVLEDKVTGYTSAYDNCENVDISNGETETCKITNTRDRGTLEIQKIVDFGNVTDWYFSLNGAPVVQADEDGYVKFENIPTGSDYKITESGPTNIFSLNSISGDNCTPDIGNLSATATVLKDIPTTCVFTNLVNRGLITIVKDAVPNDQQVFGFLFRGGNLNSGFLLDDDGDDSDGYINQKTYSNLLPGSYIITETPLSNWTLTSLQCTTNIPGKAVGPFLGTNIASISLDAGESVECTFTNTKYGSISGQKWHDLNADRGKNGEEEYIAGWSIELRSSLEDPTDLISSQLITDASQGYTFGNLLLGDYYICEVGQAGYSQSYPNTAYVYKGMDCHKVTLTAGENRTEIDFGNYTTGSVSGTKWEDMNGDGNRDLEDLGLVNWRIFIDVNENKEWDNGETYDFTDTDGIYSFNLEPGDYSICEEMQSDWAQSYPTNGYCHSITVTSGGEYQDYSFGNFEMANIKACKTDTEGNPIEGWNMTL